MPQTCPETTGRAWLTRHRYIFTLAIPSIEVPVVLRDRWDAFGYGHSKLVQMHLAKRWLASTRTICTSWKRAGETTLHFRLCSTIFGAKLTCSRHPPVLARIHIGRGPHSACYQRRIQILQRPQYPLQARPVACFVFRIISI